MHCAKCAYIRDASLLAIAGIPYFSYFSQRNPALRRLSGRKKIAFTECAQLVLVIKTFLIGPLFMPSCYTLGHFN